MIATAVLLCTVAGSWTGTTPSGWRIDAQIAATGRDVVAVPDLPDIGGFGRSLTGTIDDDCKLHLIRPQPGGRPAVTLDGLASDDAITGELQLLGATSTIALHRGPPLATHREEAVTFDNAGFRLAGTVVLPQERGKYPAVVFTHGSGTETRNVTQSLAIALARHGIASLVYDKRGSGDSMGHWEVASMEDLANDALAGVEALRARDDIDGTRIGIYGYSQGGWIAPLVAATDPTIAFVIAGGVSGVNPMEQTIHHRTEVMHQDGFNTAAVRKAMGLWRLIYRSNTKEERLEAQRQIDAVKSEPWFAASGLPAQVGGIPAKGTRDFLRFEPMTVWANIHQPVYLYWGADDLNVPVRESLRAISSVIATDDLTARIYPNVGHDLRIESADLPRISKAAMYEDWMAWVELVVKRAGPATP